MYWKRRLHGRDIPQGLALNLDSIEELSQKAKGPLSVRDTDTDSDTERYVIQTDSTQWIDCTLTRPSVPVIHRFIGGPAG
jgi:hypothetical protein